MEERLVQQGHWDVSNFTDTVQVETVAGSNREGSDGY